MKINIRGEMAIDDIIKAVVEKLKEVQSELAIHHSRGATLYINPTDGCGKKLVPHNPEGGEVDNLDCNGPYRTIADDFKF